MPDFDWKATLAGVAPVLATALGGPLAGQAVAIAAQALGLAPGASEADVATAVQGLTGDQRIALQKADNDFRVAMAQIQQATDAALLADTQNARGQTVALAQAGSRIAWAPVMISGLILLGFFACVVLLFVFEREWSERQAALLNMLFGALVLGFGQVCSYWLGSSAGSKASGDAVRKIAERAAG